MSAAALIHAHVAPARVAALHCRCGCSKQVSIHSRVRPPHTFRESQRSSAPARSPHGTDRPTHTAVPFPHRRSVHRAFRLDSSVAGPAFRCRLRERCASWAQETERILLTWSSWDVNAQFCSQTGRILRILTGILARFFTNIVSKACCCRPSFPPVLLLSSRPSLFSKLLSKLAFRLG